MTPNTTVKFLYPIIPSGSTLVLELGPHKDREKLWPGREFEPTTFGLDHRCSTDWATRPEQELAVGMWDLIHKDKFGSAQA